MTDDIEDASITRYGRPCWYRVEGVGLNAINDAVIVRGGIFQMIRKYFRKEPFFADLIDLVREVRQYPLPLEILHITPMAAGLVSDRNQTTR